MSPRLRAFLIAILGPALQGLGVAWDLIEHGLLARPEVQHLTFEHVVSAPAHLIMATGLALSLVCVPVAIEVAARSEEEPEQPEPEPGKEPVPDAWYGTITETKS